jgi:hypothetical protein
MNLILNAIEAMKEKGGVLTVKTQLGENGQLLISVSDTGVGLPKEKIEKIFDAFFTTKPQGSGMGSSISRSIVESHGGRLWATANNGRGATFHLTLPTSAEVHDSVASGDRAGPGDGSPSNEPAFESMNAGATHAAGVSSRRRWLGRSASPGRPNSRALEVSTGGSFPRPTDIKRSLGNCANARFQQVRFANPRRSLLLYYRRLELSYAMSMSVTNRVARFLTSPLSGRCGWQRNRPQYLFRPFC